MNEAVTEHVRDDQTRLCQQRNFPPLDPSVSFPASTEEYLARQDKEYRHLIYMAPGVTLWIFFKRAPEDIFRPTRLGAE